jgi:mannitol-specific phosphotransferase system IIBC component
MGVDLEANKHRCHEGYLLFAVGFPLLVSFRRLLKTKSNKKQKTKSNKKQKATKNKKTKSNTKQKTKKQKNKPNKHRCHEGYLLFAIGFPLLVSFR